MAALETAHCECWRWGLHQDRVRNADSALKKYADFAGLAGIIALGYYGIVLLLFANLVLLLIKKGSAIPNRYGKSPAAFSFANRLGLARSKSDDKLLPHLNRGETT